MPLTIKTITSVQNPLIKETAALLKRSARKQQQKLLAEGTHGVEEALKAGLLLKTLFIHRDKIKLDWLLDWLARFSTSGEDTVIEVPPAVIAKLSTLETPPEMVGVFHHPDTLTIPEFKTVPCWLVLDALQDPGNLGTLIRSAKAFGFEGIITTAGTLDVYHPKVLRATSGLIFHQRVWESNLSLVHVIETLSQGHIPCWITTCDANIPGVQHHRAIQYPASLALVLGAEGQGVAEQALREALPETWLNWLTIPMAPGVDSLNVGVSGTMLMAEVFYQHPHRATGGEG